MSSPGIHDAVDISTGHHRAFAPPGIHAETRTFTVSSPGIHYVITGHSRRGRYLHRAFASSVSGAATQRALVHERARPFGAPLKGLIVLASIGGA